MPSRRVPVGLLMAIVAAGAAAGFIVLRFQGHLASGQWDRLAPWAPAILGAAVVTTVVLVVVRMVSARVNAPAARGLGRLQILFIALAWLVAVVGAAGGFGGAAVGVGLVGFGLTLALQRPILAMAGWASIQFGGMFRPGDRIQVGDITGDVLDVSMFSTRLWEMGAPGSSTPGRPTGRIRIVSNALFLEESVANATSDTPTIFDEFVVPVAYEGDLKLAKRIIQEVASKVVDPEAHRLAASEYTRLTRGMAMERNFPAEPVIQVALEDDWVALRLRYLVDARRRGAIRSALADGWQEAIAAYPRELPPIYRRSQVQRIGADGRPERA